MPNSEPFRIAPISELLDRVLAGRTAVVDPFARDSKRATRTNDLNPRTHAEFHLEASEFALVLEREGYVPDAVLWDPPYSLRQVEEVYQSFGRGVPFGRTKDAGFGDVKDVLSRILRPCGVVVSLGWNSAGFGKERGMRLDEVLLVPHGGPHHDTIVCVERKVQSRLPVDGTGP